MIGFLAAVVLAVSGQQVPVTCQPGLAAGGEYGQYRPGAAAMVAVPAPGEPGVQNIAASYPDARIALDAGVCRSLATLIADPSGLELHYARPGLRDWYETVALLALVHEAEHAWQAANGQPLSESQAQCTAVAQLPAWLAALGVPAARAGLLERDAAVFTAGLPAAYRGC